MKASPNDQRSILDVARFDQQSTSLRHKAANLPELAELASTTVKANNARDLRIAAETELSDVKRELARAEGDVEQIVSRITRDEARLNGGSTSPKELEQLQHEIGTLGARRAELEEVELEIMMRVEAINERITTLKAEEAEHAAVIADLEIRKENALTVIHNDLDLVTKDRAETIHGIEKSLVDLYEKIRETTGGAGAAALSAGSCTGCNLSVNAVELKRVSELSDDEVVRCEECRCILVRGV
jgi:predicted  nucleic acid-binding Zn-ribbon protein